MILVVVYVGAVAVLFLFVVMMLDVDFAELRQGFLNYLPVGAADRPRCLLAELAAWCSARWISLAASRRGGADPGQPVTNTEALGRVLYTQYIYYFQVGGPGAAGRHDRRHRADAAPQGRASSGRTSPRRTRAPTTAIERKVKLGAGPAGVAARGRRGP